MCYARISSIGQKEDLERQKKLLKDKYPKCHLIEDICSWINLTKKELLKIIELGINGKITIINKETEIEPEEEMVKDILQIMNVFVAKMNGRRKYNLKSKK